MNIILILGVIGFLVLYVVYFLILSLHVASISPFAQEISSQNLIIGSLSKELSLLKSLQLMGSGSSNEQVGRFLHIYLDNIQYLQSIQL